MKRILFYTENYSNSDSRGGTEVATFRIASALKSTGKCEVFHAFRSKGDPEEKSIYSDVVMLGKSGNKFTRQLSEFIRRHEIDVVVNMTRFFRHKSIADAASRSGRDVKVMFMQHFAPGSEFKKPTFASGLHLLKLNPFNPLYWLRSTLYPIIKYPRLRRLSKIYKDVYQQSDKVILLSDGYKEDYCKTGNFRDTEKFVSIPNIFQIPDNICAGISTDDKEKKVLILSRMDEIQKRLSLALQIWKRIENDPDLNDWSLDIVGTGHNSDIVRRMIKKLKLKNVTLHGWQRREPYLQKASILMMTSEYEGLPLSILESQAYGVVPVAFDSFASLADVVAPYNNGVVVPRFGDIDDYVDKLKDLMYDDDYRRELSENAMCSADKFSPEKIAEEWLKILI